MIPRNLLGDIELELQNAIAHNTKFNSPHEGFCVLLEEVEELKAEVFKNKKMRSKDLMYDEARQVAAMAIRFMMDCCEVGGL